MVRERYVRSMYSARQRTGITHVAPKPHLGEVRAGSHPQRQTATTRTEPGRRLPAPGMVQREFRDSSRLGVILSARKRAGGVGGRFRRAVMRTQPTRRARTTGLEERLCLDADVASAAERTWNQS